MEKETTGRTSFIFDSRKLPKGKYKYVYPYMLRNKEIIYKAYIKKYNYTTTWHTEREAAIAVDKALLNKGDKPVNILVKK